MAKDADDTTAHRRLMQNVSKLRQEGGINDDVARAAQDAILDDANEGSELDRLED